MEDKVVFRGFENFKTICDADERLLKGGYDYGTDKMNTKKWFISAFLEVECTQGCNEVNRDLARVGNLFDSEDEARDALHFLKCKIGEYKRNGQEKH